MLRHCSTISFKKLYFTLMPKCNHLIEILQKIKLKKLSVFFQHTTPEAPTILCESQDRSCGLQTTWKCGKREKYFNELPSLYIGSLRGSLFRIQCINICTLFDKSVFVSTHHFFESTFHANVSSQACRSMKTALL